MGRLCSIYVPKSSLKNFQTLRELVGWGEKEGEKEREMMSGKEGIITSSNDVSTKTASFKIDDTKQRRNI
jgi:hypothetical protein